MGNNIEDYESKEFIDMKNQKMAMMQKERDKYMKDLILKVLYDNQGNELTSEQIREEVNKRLDEIRSRLED
jgi:flagellar basal body-associated protein FliL